jgi:hypothetical protein
MADKTFDVVIIGAGTKSMSAAVYLAKYGKLSVGIFEDRHEAAGGWCSEEALGGGFVNDACSSQYLHPGMYFGPLLEDFPELRDNGLRFVPHPVGPVNITSDNRTMSIWSEEFDPDQKKTAESIAQWSKKDAETWLRIWELWKTKWQQAFYEWCFTPVNPMNDAMMKLFANPKENGVDPQWMMKDSVQFLEEFCDSEAMMAFLYRNAETTGFNSAERGGFLNLLGNLMYTGGSAASRGGSHNTAHAFVRTITQHGGEIYYRRAVKKITIEGGKATGIVLDDGTEIAARVAVLSGVDVQQVMFDFTGPEYFDPVDVEKVKMLHADFPLYWFSCALSEAPVLNAADVDPDMKWGAGINLFQKEPNLAVISEFHDYKMRREEMPKDVILPMYLNHGLIDTTRRPNNGMVSLLFESYNLGKSITKHPTDRAFMKDYWPAVERFIDVFLPFHKNITRDKIYGISIQGPRQLLGTAKSYFQGCVPGIDGKEGQDPPFRPTPNLASGRLPIKNLYATGGMWQQGPYASAWGGYCIYKLMAEDLGLGKPWEERGRITEKVETCYKYLEEFRVIDKDMPADFPTPYTTTDGHSWTKVESKKGE